MKVNIVSLGCAKNLVDSERILGMLVKQYDIEIVTDQSEADIIIINTCGFIDSAKEESIDAVINAIPYKRNKCKLLIVTGCLVTKYQKELESEIPEVDIWLNALNFEKIGVEINKHIKLKDNKNSCYYSVVSDRVLSTPEHWAYLKIAEGCNNKCTFCTIPQLRGPYISRPIEDIVKEAQQLADSGVREINLLAQDTTFYGKDLYGEVALIPLLKELCKTDIYRFRILYSYPHRVTRELIEYINSEDKICSYLDIPMQHASDSVLMAMGRPERLEQLKEMVDTIRSIDSDFTIRSTFIVGFPGETDEDFDILCDFLKYAELDFVGVFPYSPQEDTISYTLPDQIDEETKNNRYDTAMALLSRLSANSQEKWIGKEEKVIIDSSIPADENSGYNYIGRCSFQAPDVDGITYIKGDGQYLPGDIVPVKITGSDVYDLTGEIIPPIK